MTLGEMTGSLQKTVFQFATSATYYKAKASHHDKRQQIEIQSLAKKIDKAEHAEERSTKLYQEVLNLEEKTALTESKATQLKRELSETKVELHITRSEQDT